MLNSNGDRSALGIATQAAGVSSKSLLVDDWFRSHTMLYSCITVVLYNIFIYIYNMYVYIYIYIYYWGIYIYNIHIYLYYISAWGDDHTPTCTTATAGGHRPALRLTCDYRDPDGPHGRWSVVASRRVAAL